MQQYKLPNLLYNGNIRVNHFTILGIWGRKIYEIQCKPCSGIADWRAVGRKKDDALSLGDEQRRHTFHAQKYHARYNRGQYAVYDHLDCGRI